MAWVEGDRVQIRLYIGYSALYLQADPRLESAITAVQATTDGGTRPDNSSELAMRGIISQLQQIDTNLSALWPLFGAAAVGTIKLNITKQMIQLRMEGRRLVHRLCRFMDAKPYSDIFASAPDDDFDGPGAFRPAPNNGRIGY